MKFIIRAYLCSSYTLLRHVCVIAGLVGPAGSLGIKGATGDSHLGSFKQYCIMTFSTAYASAGNILPCKGKGLPWLIEEMVYV